MKNDLIFDTLRRYLFFTASLFIMSIGVALTLRSGLGSSPVSLLPYAWSMASGVQVDCLGLSFTVPSWSVGQYTIAMNALLVFLQVILLRKAFKTKHLLQMFTGFFFGLFIDVSMWLTAWFVFDTSTLGYALRVVELLVAGSILGFGIACQVRCNALLLPGEGFCVALSKVTGMDFGKAKIYNDTTLVGIGIVFCFIFFHSWRWDITGVATLVSMVYVGVMVRFFSFRLGWFEILLTGGEQQVQPEVASAEFANDNFVITIGREFGSGGHEMGEKLAKQLGVTFIDHAIISETANQLGINSQLVERIEQNISTSKLLELVMTDKQIPENTSPSEDDKVFIAQSKIIRHHASTQSCVIVGRVANCILKDHPRCLRLFVYSDIDFAKQRVMAEFGYDEEKARKEIHRINQARGNHYWQYTGAKWNDPSQYDLFINSSKLGIDNAVTLVANALKALGYSGTGNKKG